MLALYQKEMQQKLIIRPDLSGRKNQKNKLLFFNKLRR